MLVKSNCRTPFLGLPAGNCDFLKEITLFRYSPFIFPYKKVDKFYWRIDNIEVL